VSDYDAYDEFEDEYDEDEDDIDIEDLRSRLIDEAYAAAATGIPAMILDAGEIEQAGPRELIAIARRRETL
jgi:uncharacterized protein (DUF2336 family)